MSQVSLGDFHLSLSILIPPPTFSCEIENGRGAGSMTRISVVVQSLREQSVF